MNCYSDRFSLIDVATIMVWANDSTGEWVTVTVCHSSMLQQQWGSILSDEQPKGYSDRFSLIDAATVIEFRPFHGRFDLEACLSP